MFATDVVAIRLPRRLSVSRAMSGLQLPAGCWPWTTDNGAVFSLVRPPAGALDDLVREQAGCDLSYREAGATAGTMPPVDRHDRWQIDLGALDGGTFARLAAALLHWQPQRGARFTVFPGAAVTPA